MDLQIVRTRYPPEAYLEQLLAIVHIEAPEVALEDLKRRLQELPGEDRFFLALDADTLIGYAHFSISRRLEADESVELADIVVLPEFRRQGVGRTLMAAAETWALQSERACLQLRANVINTDALAFFASLGFEPSGTSQEYVRDLDINRQADAPTQPQQD